MFLFSQQKVISFHKQDAIEIWPFLALSKNIILSQKRPDFLVIGHILFILLSGIHPLPGITWPISQKRIMDMVLLGPKQSILAHRPNQNTDYWECFIAKPSPLGPILAIGCLVQSLLIIVPRR